MRPRLDRWFELVLLCGAGCGDDGGHGAAETLEDLFDPAGDFGTHLQAGNAVFNPTASDVSDLVASLRTIDDNTEPFEVPAEYVFCPTGVVPPLP